MFRVTKNFRKVVVKVYKDGELLKEVKRPHMAPAEMEKIKLTKAELEGLKESLVFTVEE